MQTTIDLNDFRINGEFDFTSRTSGLSVRINSGVVVKASFGKVTIIIPSEIFNISTSFWKEFLGNVILDLRTEEAFWERVNFECLGNYNPKNEITQIVKEFTSLAGFGGK